MNFFCFGWEDRQPSTIGKTATGTRARVVFASYALHDKIIGRNVATTIYSSHSRATLDTLYLYDIIVSLLLSVHPPLNKSREKKVVA